MDFLRRFVLKCGIFSKCGRFAAAIAATGATVALLAACHDGPFDEPSPTEQIVPATTTIAEIRHLTGGASTTVTGDLVVCGIVTTSDRRYNFYHTLCIESDGAALEVMAAVDRLHVDYPIGCRVSVLLKGLTIGSYRGVLQVGTKPDVGSYYPTGYLASLAAVAAHLVRADETLSPVHPTRWAIRHLTPDLCGTLVRIDGVHLVPENEADAENRWAGVHRFCDNAGNAVYSYVRAGADFADTGIPSGKCSLVGILQYEEQSGGRYLIKLRDENDCIH